MTTTTLQAARPGQRLRDAARHSFTIIGILAQLTSVAWAAIAMWRSSLYWLTTVLVVYLALLGVVWTAAQNWRRRVTP